MRIYAAGLATETNTFAPFPTGRIAFEEAGVFRGDGSFGDGALSPMLRAWRRAAEAEGHEFVEGLSSMAQPGGTTPRVVYEAYRDEILAGLDAAGEPDVVLLALHGAMVAEGYEDCEGDLIARIRARVRPDTIIGGELDPHFHLTERMRRNADVLISAKEYPHTDFADRARELIAICVAARRGEVRPVMAAFDCRMVGWYPTTSEPMRTLVDRACAMEREPGVLSVSICHGFPWADVPEAGTKVLVVADGDRGVAAAKAAELGAALYAARWDLLPRFPPLGEALDKALSLDGRVVIADVADNAGGAAPSDNTGMLRELLRRRVRDAACGIFWDPVAARICADAGRGARLPLRLGGKCFGVSDEPLDLDVVVRAIAEDHRQGRFGSGMRLGLSVWLEVSGIDVVVSSIRGQVFAPNAFTDLGVDLAAKRLIAVKSSQHFQAGFRPIADHVIQVATRGTLEMDFASLPYARRDGRYFPKVADPLGPQG